MKELFTIYGKESSFEFNFESIESKCLNTYWKNIDDPINYSIECISLFDPYKACVLSRMIGSCVEHGFDSPKLDLVINFCKKITDLIISFINDFGKAKGLTNDDSIFNSFFSQISSIVSIPWSFNTFLDNYHTVDLEIDDQHKNAVLVADRNIKLAQFEF